MRLEWLDSELGSHFPDSTYSIIAMELDKLILGDLYETVVNRFNKSFPDSKKELCTESGEDFLTQPLWTPMRCVNPQCFTEKSINPWRGPLGKAGASYGNGPRCPVCMSILVRHTRPKKDEDFYI